MVRDGQSISRDAVLTPTLPSKEAGTVRAILEEARSSLPAELSAGFGRRERIKRALANYRSEKFFQDRAAAYGPQREAILDLGQQLEIVLQKLARISPLHQNTLAAISEAADGSEEWHDLTEFHDGVARLSSAIHLLEDKYRPARSRPNNHALERAVRNLFAILAPSKVRCFCAPRSKAWRQIHATIVALLQAVDPKLDKTTIANMLERARMGLNEVAHPNEVLSRLGR